MNAKVAGGLYLLVLAFDGPKGTLGWPKLGKAIFFMLLFSTVANNWTLSYHQQKEIYVIITTIVHRYSNKYILPKLERKQGTGRLKCGPTKQKTRRFWKCSTRY